MTASGELLSLFFFSFPHSIHVLLGSHILSTIPLHHSSIQTHTLTLTQSPHTHTHTHTHTVILRLGVHHSKKPNIEY